MMKDLSERISSLSPQRRQLLERLLKGQGRHAPAEPGAQTGEQASRGGPPRPQDTTQQPAPAGNDGFGGTVRFDYDAHDERCNALGMSDSGSCQRMKSGLSSFRLLRLQKPLSS